MAGILLPDVFSEGLGTEKDEFAHLFVIPNIYLILLNKLPTPHEKSFCFLNFVQFEENLKHNFAS